jgi:excisionase family DNA binding protein
MPNKITDVETVLSCFDTAYLLHISMDRLRELARTGKIGHRRVGNRYYFSADEINAYRGGKIVPAKV